LRRAGADSVTEVRVDGDHQLDRHRFDAIVDWVMKQVGG
jgi:hypothetical protein